MVTVTVQAPSDQTGNGDVSTPNPDTVNTPVVMITHVDGGSGFVPYTDGMAVHTDMPRFRGTSDGYDTVRLQVRDSNGIITQIGSGMGISDDGSFQRGRTILSDGTYTILVGSVQLGTITVDTAPSVVESGPPPANTTTPARSVSITQIHDGSGFVPYTDGMTVHTDMPRFRGTSDGYDSIVLQVRDSNGTVTQIGSGTGISDDGSFQRGRTTLSDGTYGIFVNSESDTILGTFTVRTNR